MGHLKIPPKTYPKNAPKRPPNQERQADRAGKKAKLFDGHAIKINRFRAVIFLSKRCLDGRFSLGSIAIDWIGIIGIP